jgi:hypothetical protein
MTPIESLLQALREAESDVAPPPHLQRAVLAAWDAEHGRHGHRRPDVRDEAPTAGGGLDRWGRLGAVAAGMMLTTALTMLGTALRGGSEGTVHRNTALVFVGEPIRADEPVRVVRMRLPAAALGAIGLRSATGGAGEVVDVDLIVGEDGVARAIRLGM